MSGSNCLERGRVCFNYCPASGLLEEEGASVSCIELEKWKLMLGLALVILALVGCIECRIR